MDAYSDTPCCVSSSDESISISDVKAFNMYQEMKLAEEELKEKTLHDLLNEVEEELSETQLSDGIFVHKVNKLKELEQ